MYSIGLTGSIASGKSAVSALFAKHGIQIINADHIARELTSPEQPAFKAIIEHFGQEVLTSTGILNRPYLRRIIFNHTMERKWLENLLHPLIRTHIKALLDQSQSQYCIIEIPLLIDKTSYPYMDRVLAIMAPYEQRLKRLTQRDSCTEKEALLILAAQADDATYQSVADDIIINEGSIKDLEIKVTHLHQQYMQKSRQKKSS